MLVFSLVLSGCVVSASPIEVSLPDARSAVVVNLSASGEARVFAIELGEDDQGRFSVPRGAENDELYVVPYGCPLSRLQLPSGEIELAIDTQKPAIPPTRRPILHGRAPAEGAISFQELTAMPPALAELRLLIDHASEGCCPAYILDGPVNVTFRACGERHCAAQVSKNADTCELTIDTSPCASVTGGSFGTLTVSIEANGQIRAVPTPSPTTDCQEILPRPHTSASFDCALPRECPLDVRLPPKEPLFEVTTATVIPGVPRFGENIDRPSYANARQGYLSDMALLQDELVIASFSGQIFSNPDQLCTDQVPPTTFHFFDADTLQQVATSTAPRCSLLLARDPSETGFLSAYSEPAAGGYNFFVVRYDARGRERNRSAPIFVEATSPEYTLRPNALLADIQDPHPVYLATGWGYLGTGTPEKQLELVLKFRSPRDLTVVQRIQASDLSTTALDIRNFANVDERDGDIAWVEGVTDAVRWVDSSTTPALVDDDPGEMVFHLPSNRLIVPTLDERGGIFVVSRMDRENSDRVRPVPPFDSDAGFSSVAVWPMNQTLLLAGGLAERVPQGSARDAAIALFSPVEMSFVPGMQRIGWGPVRKLTPHALNRVYGILPWSAQLVRIRAR